MSLCGTIIREISWLERQTQISVSKICRIKALQKCSDWEDQGYSKCNKKQDKGYKDCCDWWPCSWLCDAWVWVSHIVCVVWSWVSKWICRILNWIYTAVCKFVVSVVFWFIRRVLILIITIPCKSGEPELDPRIRHIFVLVLEKPVLRSHVRRYADRGHGCGDRRCDANQAPP